jgi:hypothetical protein
MNTNDIDTFFALIDVYARKTLVDAAVEMAPAVQPLGVLLANVRKAKTLLDLVALFVEDEMVKASPGKQFVIDGVGEAELHTGAKRTAWDKPAVMTALAHVLAGTLPDLVDTSTGEPVDQVALVQGVLDGLLKSVTPNFKVTGLRAAFIDPDEYCTTEWGRKSIQLPSIEGFVPMGVVVNGD